VAIVPYPNPALSTGVINQPEKPLRHLLAGPFPEVPIPTRPLRAASARRDSRSNRQGKSVMKENCRADDPAPDETTDRERTESIVVVRPDPRALTERGLTGFVGLSSQTAGTRALAMELVILPPGALASPHVHPEHETVLYLLKGRVEVLYGKGLQRSAVCEAGDFVLTPPGVPHQPRNLSSTEPVHAIAARNDPDRHEASIPYDPTPDI
jgi:uncharacterized RmlC-like cupin family protein